MALEPDEQRLVDDVATYGWHIIRVSSGEDEPQEPPFAYTVGLGATFGWPELLCYGLEQDTMAQLLNNAIEELKARSVIPGDGLALKDVAEGFECRLSPVAKRHIEEHLGYALWFARHRRESPSGVRCLQMLWPDRNGRFPDDPKCAEGVRELQPLLAS